MSIFSFSVFSWNALLNFKTIFLSILLEALPFLLLSVAVSALLHQLLSEQLLTKLLPRNTTIGITCACFAGLLFPACDCGTVPIARRLVAKGVPLPIAVTFMLAAPIMNPVVIWSTAYAFSDWNFTVARVFFASVTACGVGYLSGRFFSDCQLQATISSAAEEPVSRDTSWQERLQQFFQMTCNEFFDMGRFLICGALLGAAAQTFLPRTLLLDLGHTPFLSILVMMSFAFVISVCSSADSFIAASFINSFSPGSLLAFMVLGPMLDLKNLLMLQHVFRPRYVLFLSVTIPTLCGFFAYCYNTL